MEKCSSCGTAVMRGYVKLKCPTCGKADIVRCASCRVLGTKYVCKDCSFEGP